MNSTIPTPDSDMDWDPKHVEVHGLHPDHPMIRDAETIDIVWPKFQQWLEDLVEPEERVILVAWNGESCDLKWIWKLTQAPRSLLSMPACIEYFLDPRRVIQKYTSCSLNPIKSKLDSLELGVVWKFLFGQNLNGAHDSLIDAVAQTDIIVHPSFVPFLDRSQSVKTIDEIFSKKLQAEWRKEMEPTRLIHSPWKEQLPEDSKEWEPVEEDSYTGDG